MQFQKGNKIGNRFLAGESGNPAGYPKGVKNRSTIAKKVLDLISIFPDETFEKLKAIYPDLEKTMTAEEMAYVVAISNAIAKADTNAFKLVLDSAYGAKEEVKHTGEIGIIWKETKNYGSND